MSVQVALRIASHLLGGDGLAWVTIFGFFPNWAGPFWTWFSWVKSKVLLSHFIMDCWVYLSSIRLIEWP